MFRIKFYILLLLVFFSATSAMAQKPIAVVATIGQITDVVKKIGAERVSVQGLMGPGVDPHLYKASQSDVSKLAKADIIFYNGIHLEAKMADLFERMSRSKKTVAVGDAVPKENLLGDLQYPDLHDPHIWFDVTIWMRVAQRIKETLVDFDPAHKAEYEANAQKYLEELQELHLFVQGKSRELSKEERVLVTAHDAFRYFGRQYDFEVIGLQGISTEAQAGAKDVMELAEMIASRKIRAIFVESSVSERNIKAVQEAVKSRGWDVQIGGELFSDAMGDQETFEGTYVGMITKNINTIVNALKGKQE